MLEDCAMEKKPLNRSVQPPGKGSSESKKSQDVSNVKQFGRGCRRRETPGSSNSSKIEQFRRPQLQKTKPFDKRPRPRGQNYFCGKEDSQVGETDAEYGSVLTHGSKKHNLNHLLNFHYAPRGIETLPAPRPSAHHTIRWLASTHKHKYNKEQFLQANCQFVVRSSGDYTPYIADPDTLVDWDMVEQIRVLSAEAVTCPICLCIPTAGKMTRCGHVFCWPCILHYLALSDKTWRKCPICYEAVHRKDLKSVLSLPRCQPATGQEITLQLMKRERGSLVAAPVSQFDARNNNTLLSVSEKCLDTVFSKLLLADAAEVLSILEHEEKELKAQMTEDEGCPELCFVEQALQLLAERRTLLLAGSKEVAEEDEGQFSPAIDHQDIVVEKQAAHPFDNTSEEPMLVDKSVLDNESTFGSDPLAMQREEAHEFDCNVNRPRYESQSSEGEEIGTAITAEDLEISVSHNTNNPAKHFYFYQAEDGQQVYLHAVNARMLEMSYGSLEQCPPLLKGRIVEKEAGSMTEELRRRLRYLQHLPVTCQFEVVEIHLAPPLITVDTAEAFRDQLEKRRKRRERAARDERRREKKIEATQYGHHRPAAKIRIESYHQFPQCGTAIDTQAFQPPVRSLSAESSRTSSPSSVSRCHSTSPLDSAMAALALEQAKQTILPQSLLDSAVVSSPPKDGPSFAQMLREGKMKVSHGGGGWGVTLPVAAAVPQQMDAEDYALVPRFKQSFSDAIAQAIEMAATHQGSNGETEVMSGKKKKKKQKVLFTTGMACTGK